MIENKREKFSFYLSEWFNLMLFVKDEYQKLEVHAFEMEAKLASLNEALAAAIEEKHEAFSRSEILDSELEAVSSKLESANDEIESLQDDVTRMV